MKLRILSDLHLEFIGMGIEAAGEDILLLSGDIGIHTQGMDWAQRVAKHLDIPVLMIAGNHEFYRNPRYPHHTWESTLLDLREAADHLDKIEKGKVTFFENGYADYEGVRFIGASLWTDMKLFGDDPIVPHLVGQAMNDYHVIHSEVSDQMLQPFQSMQRHAESRKFITNQLQVAADGYDGFTGKCVVMTHHTPTSLSVPDKYKNDRISAGYSSRLEPLIEQYKPVVWCHGHTHDSYDYMLYDTRIICNPRGYAEIDPNEEFEVNKLVAI